MITVISKDIIEAIILRLQSKRIITSKGCWETELSSKSSGHVQIMFEGTLYYIHRISAIHYLELNQDDSNQLALHKNECNNPACWNPEHLYIGTYQDNFHDAVDKGMLLFGGIQYSKYKGATHCINGHEFTKKNTYIRPNGNRTCKECNKLRARKRKAA